MEDVVANFFPRKCSTIQALMSLTRLAARAGDVLNSALRITVKEPNWRFNGLNMGQRQTIEAQLGGADRWQKLSLKVQATGLYGVEFACLFDIMARYQQAQVREVSLRIEAGSKSAQNKRLFVDSFACNAAPHETIADRACLLGRFTFRFLAFSFP